MKHEVKQLESGESASPVITRLLGSYLTGGQEDVFKFAAWEKVGMRLLNSLPVGLSKTAVRQRFQASALDPEEALAVGTVDLVDARLNDYAALRGQKFPAIMIGAAMGGATAHLAALLGIPFLPQPFILGMRGGSPDDELDAHLELTSRVARHVLDQNPELMAIAHFDPIHDGWLTRVVSHLRFKLITLPEGYRRFIQDVLEPGGVILFLDCGAQWLQYQIGERHRYQIGGWGGLPAREFLDGSGRIDTALEQAGSPHRGGWSLGDRRTLELPESEWGSEPGLASAVEGFAEEKGYRFERIVGKDPQDFSMLAYTAHRSFYAGQNRQAQGVVVETFTQYDPGLTLRAGLIPLWLIFNTTDSLAFLRSMTTNFPGDLPVFFSGLVTLSRTPDMVPWGEWAQALSPFDMHNVGARPHRYPEDLVSLWAWQERLRKQLDPERWQSAPGCMPTEVFLRLARSLRMAA
jgi:hypothetical protein